MEWTAIHCQNADTLILTDRLMSLMPLSKPTAMKQIGVKRECGYEKWQAWGYTELNPLWMG